MNKLPEWKFVEIPENQSQKIDAHVEIFCKDCTNTLNIEKCDTCESGSNWEGEETPDGE